MAATGVLPTLAFCLASSCLFAQTTFEVASIKESGAGFRGISTTDDGRYSALGVTLKSLIATAYGVPVFRVEGGPGWSNSQLWDVEAKAPEKLSGAAIEAPLAALLESRFKLRVVKELKEGNVFFLDVAKSGVKMKPGAGRSSVGAGNGMISSPNLTMALLTTTLTRLLGRPVLDRTGLTTGYEVYITWTFEAGEGDPTLSAPRPELNFDKRSIFAALEEDLGLKLSSSKQPIPLVTILSADRPDAN